MCFKILFETIPVTVSITDFATIGADGQDILERFDLSPGTLQSGDQFVLFLFGFFQSCNIPQYIDDRLYFTIFKFRTGNHLDCLKAFQLAVENHFPLHGLTGREHLFMLGPDMPALFLRITNLFVGFTQILLGRQAGLGVDNRIGEDMAVLAIQPGNTVLSVG